MIAAVSEVARYTPFEIKWRVSIAEIAYLIARRRQAAGELVEKQTKDAETIARLNELMDQRIAEYRAMDARKNAKKRTKKTNNGQS